MRINCNNAPYWPTLMSKDAKIGKFWWMSAAKAWKKNKTIFDSAAFQLLTRPHPSPRPRPARRLRRPYRSVREQVRHGSTFEPETPDHMSLKLPCLPVQLTSTNSSLASSSSSSGPLEAEVCGSSLNFTSTCFIINEYSLTVKLKPEAFWSYVCYLEEEPSLNITLTFRNRK